METKQADTRQEILEAIAELQAQQLVIQKYVDENVLPKEVQETLVNELDDTQSAISSLFYVLEQYYKTTCKQCGRIMETEQPSHEQEYVCGGCSDAVRRSQ